MLTSHAADGGEFLSGALGSNSGCGNDAIPCLDLLERPTRQRSARRRVFYAVTRVVATAEDDDDDGDDNNGQDVTTTVAAVTGDEPFILISHDARDLFSVSR